MERRSRSRRRRVIAIAATALAVAGMVGAASAAAKPRTALIVEGRSIGGLKLGDTRARAAAIFGSVSQCSRTSDQLGRECELGANSHVEATFDLLGRAVAISAWYRTNVSQPVVPPLLRDGRYATRRGVGAALMSGRLKHFYGARLKKATGPGVSGRPPLYVTGPAGSLTAFEYVGALKGGQVTTVTVARWLKPAVTVAPASAGPGSVVHVAASGLLPGAPYRVSLVFSPHKTGVLAGVATAAADGRVALDVPFDGALTEALLDAFPPATAPPAAAVRVEALQAPDDDSEFPGRPALRPFWLGAYSVDAPLQLAAVTPTLSVDNAQPLDLSQGLTVRLGGVRPTAVVESGNVGYTVTLDACRGFDLTGDIQGGVLSVPAALTVNGQSGLGCTRGNTAPKVRSGTITLTREALGGNPVTLAVLPITYRVDTG